MNPLLIAAAATALTAPAPSARLGALTRNVQRFSTPRLHSTLCIAGIALALGLVAAKRVSVVLAAVMAGATVVDLIVRRREQRQRAKGAAVTADFLGHVVANLDAGAPLPRACVTAAERLPETAPAPLARDIHRLVHHIRLGHSAAQIEVPTAQPELARMVTLWRLATGRGIPVAQLLRAARDELDHAERHRAATTAALAGPRTTAMVLAALPLAGMLMGAAMGANPVGLLTSGGIGGVLLVVGTALVCAGTVVSRVIIERAAQ